MRKLRICAPGRINLLGEHLDYNHGIVLPAAIDRHFEFDFEESTSSSFVIEALDLYESWCFERADLASIQTNGWRSYVKGIFTLMFSDDDYFSLNRSSSSSSSSSSSVSSPSVRFGLHIRFKSTIPIGAGLSSSAALCCGLAYGLNEWFDLGKSRFELAQIAQQTEHQFAGVKCGLMDQVASLFGKKNELISFDCLDLTIQTFSLPLRDVQLFLVDSKVKHNLAESAYNQRRAQLEAAWFKAKELFPSLESWRAISENQLLLLFAHLDQDTQKRLRYVTDEIARVEKVQALALEISEKVKHSVLPTEGYQKLGVLLNETHEGLRDLYEVSCAEIDFLQAGLIEKLKILGARMMGGGFGGCLLVLATQDFNFSALDDLFAHYEQLFGARPITEQIELVAGVHVL